MHFDIDADRVKQIARAVQQTCGASSRRPPYARILEGLAQGLGYRDWNTLAADLKDGDARDPDDAPVQILSGALSGARELAYAYLRRQQGPGPFPMLLNLLDGTSHRAVGHRVADGPWIHPVLAVETAPGAVRVWGDYGRDHPTYATLDDARAAIADRLAAD